jgi:hypothetical protein
MCVGKFRESWNEEAKRVVRFVSPSSKHVRIQREPESKWEGYIWNCLIFTVEMEVISTSSRLHLLHSMSIRGKCPPYPSGHELLETTLSLKKASSWMQILNFQRLAKMEVLRVQGRQSLYKCSSYCYQFQSQSSCWIIVILQCARYFHFVYHFQFFLHWPKVHACLSLSVSSYMESAFEGTFGLTRITLFLH